MKYKFTQIEPLPRLTLTVPSFISEIGLKEALYEDERINLFPINLPEALSLAGASLTDLPDYDFVFYPTQKGFNEMNIRAMQCAGGIAVKKWIRNPTKISITDYYIFAKCIASPVRD